MATATEHLAQANQHIADAERRIENQRDLVERCRERGQDLVQAHELLATMLQVMQTMQRHRRVILSEVEIEDRARA